MPFFLFKKSKFDAAKQDISAFLTLRADQSHCIYIVVVHSQYINTAS
jgi:hypothetical protein